MTFHNSFFFHFLWHSGVLVILVCIFHSIKLQEMNAEGIIMGRKDSFWFLVLLALGLKVVVIFFTFRIMTKTKNQFIGFLYTARLSCILDAHTQRMELQIYSWVLPKLNVYPLNKIFGKSTMWTLVCSKPTIFAKNNRLKFSDGKNNHFLVFFFFSFLFISVISFSGVVFGMTSANENETREAQRKKKKIIFQFHPCLDCFIFSTFLWQRYLHHAICIYFWVGTQFIFYVSGIIIICRREWKLCWIGLRIFIFVFFLFLSFSTIRSWLKWILYKWETYMEYDCYIYEFCFSSSSYKLLCATIPNEDWRKGGHIQKELKLSTGKHCQWKTMNTNYECNEFHISSFNRSEMLSRRQSVIILIIRWQHARLSFLV